jgi:hypothetical protein
MQTKIGPIFVELDDDTIMIRDVKTKQLIKAKTVQPGTALDTYNDLVKTLTEKHRARS